TITGRHPGVRLVYLPAEVPSLTVQRNQAIAEAGADIVFMIDDDSFMHPDCAEEILRVYDADAKGEIAGIQATTAPMPDTLTFEAPQKQKGRPRTGGIARWLWRKVFLMNVEEGFIPYDK